MICLNCGRLLQAASFGQSGLCPAMLQPDKLKSVTDEASALEPGCMPLQSGCYMTCLYVARHGTLLWLTKLRLTWGSPEGRRPASCHQ